MMAAHCLRKVPALLATVALVLAACQPVEDDPAVSVATIQSEAGVRAPEPASPWEAAAARGVGFRAVGNEPGWYVEVDRGEAPSLRAVLDYGDRVVEVQRVSAIAGRDFGYQGTANDGSEVVLRIDREACSDGMSDQRYAFSATLRVDGQAYRGCGRRLSE